MAWTKGMRGNPFIGAANRGGMGQLSTTARAWQDYACSAVAGRSINEHCMKAMRRRPLSFAAIRAALARSEATGWPHDEKRGAHQRTMHRAIRRKEES
jgi:hypothetical protein